MVESHSASGESAFQQRYEELAPALHAWAELRIRPEVRGLIDPQDVVQEVWCRAWRQRELADPGGEGFRPWLFTVAKNVLLEAFRKLRSPAFRAGSAGTTARLVALEGVPDSITAVSRRVARDEGLTRLVGWLRELDGEERLLVAQVGLEGQPFGEVADRLGLTRDAAAKRWQRLRARLSEQPAARSLLLE